MDPQRNRIFSAAGAGVVLPLLAAVVAVSLMSWTPYIAGGPALPWKTAGLLVLFIGLFLSKGVPDHIAALVLLFGAGAIVELPLDVVFSGFRSSAAWIIFAGLIIGAAMTETGLGDRLARAMLRRTGARYGTVIYGVFLTGTLLVFLLPTAVGRVVLLVPIAIAVAEKLGFAVGHPGRNGIVLSAVLGTMLPAYAVLPSTLPNVVMLGTAQNLYGVGFSYAEYFLATFPALAVPTLIVAPFLLIRMFPAATSTTRSVEDRDRPGNGRASVMAWILGAALVLWATDFLHGFSPVWIALGAAIACLAPGIGTIRHTSFDNCVKIGPWLLIASVVSLAAMIDYSGLGRLVGGEMIAALALQPGETALNFVKIAGVSTLVGLATTSVASPAIMTSLAETVASAAGWPLEAVLLAQVPSWFFILLPYQTPIMIVALSAGKLAVGPVARYLVVLAAVGFLVATPLYYFWLRMLGYLP